MSKHQITIYLPNPLITFMDFKVELEGFKSRSDYIISLIRKDQAERQPIV